MANSATTTTPPRTVARFRDRAGASHRVIIRVIPNGWEIIDVATRVLDTLDAAYDDADNANAIVRAFVEQHRQRPQR
jgi:hypothetical protein